MKDYFSDLEFQEPEFPEQFRPKAKPEVVLPPKEAFAEANEFINQEIQKMQNGTSKLVHYSLHFKDGMCPAINVLNRFMADPNEKLMLEFFKLAEQDFGLNAARAFRDKIKEVVKRGK
jgi:hypothetical protein